MLRELRADDAGAVAALIVGANPRRIDADQLERAEHELGKAPAHFPRGCSAIRAPGRAGAAGLSWRSLS